MAGGIPDRDLNPGGAAKAFRTFELPQGQVQERGGVGQVFAQHQNGVGLLDVLQVCGRHRTALQDGQDVLQQGQLAAGQTGIEIGLPHQHLQRKVGF